MKIIKNITAHEMARRFALGEVHSRFFFPHEESVEQETIQFLTSGDYTLERRGIERHWKSHGPFVDSLPKDTDWHLAKLNLSEDEFSIFHTVNVDGWIRYTNRSLKLIDAAIYLQANPGCDQRVDAIISAFKKNQFEFTGITLFGQKMEGPLTIVEGTARLVALYLNCFQKNIRALCDEEIQVVIGLSQAKWHFS